MREAIAIACLIWIASCSSLLGLDDDWTEYNDFEVFAAKYDSKGRHEWSQSLNFGNPVSIAVDNGDNAIVAGPDNLSKIDSSGGYVWNKNFLNSNEFEESGEIQVTSVSVDGLDSIVVAGNFGGLKVNFGGDSLINDSPGLGDYFLVKLDSSGSHIWSKRFGDEGNDGTITAAQGDGDNIFLAGIISPASNRTVDFGGGPLSGHLFLVKLDPSGNHLWSDAFVATPNLEEELEDPMEPLLSSLSTDSSNSVLLTGITNGITDFGTGPLEDDGADNPVYFAAKFDSDGNCLWSKSFGGSSWSYSEDSYPSDWEQGSSAALDSKGNAIIAISAGDAFHLEGSPPSNSSVGDLVVTKLDSTGSHSWSIALKGGGDHFVAVDSVVLDSSNNILIIGNFSGSLNLGGSVSLRGRNSGFTPFLLKLNSNGKHLWSYSFDHNYNTAVSTDSSNNALIVGNWFS
ncbi:MAG: hypothetical protein GY847_27485 [Proteobacteria bacterium]|nr:hypothetical protein [Pseudomonadota bacterium]